MRTGRTLGFMGAGVLGVVIGCSANEQDSASPAGGLGSFSDAGGNGVFEPGGQGPGDKGGALGAGGSSAALPPEKEVDTGFELPHAGARFVYVANTDNNTIAVIDAKTLAIQTIDAGIQPRFLQTFGTADAAIVLNVGSSDA